MGKDMGEPQERQLALPGAVTSVGVVFPDGLSLEQWEAAGLALAGAERSVLWWVGDWLRYGEPRFRDGYARILDRLPFAYATVRNAKWVADCYPDLSRRLDKLSWNHHQIAAALNPEERVEMLSLAEENGWSTRDLKAAISRRKAAREIGAAHLGDEGCTVEDLHRLAKTGARYGTVYADPPWLYDNQATRASTGDNYGGMTVDELCELPVADLAADKAHLHLWTTNAFLFECPRIFEAWGFEFRSSFVWVKPTIGTGNYWRNAHEFLLTGIRGKAKSFEDKSLRSWLECERGQHSAKPPHVRGFLERASPGPRLELFGRQPAAGWTVWSDQIERAQFDHDARAAAA